MIHIMTSMPPSLAPSDAVATCVQFCYELPGCPGVLGVHTNHCGAREWAWELELLGPDTRLALRFGAPGMGAASPSVIEGVVDGEKVRELIVEEEGAGEDASNDPKVHAWLSAIDAGDPARVRCDFEDAVAALIAKVNAARDAATI